MLKVTNPLTIIAIFAGIAEAFATIALIGLPIEIQYIFIWFVMAFPTIIVIIFFIILIEKPMFLYGPSDYKNSEDFLFTHGLITRKDVNDAAKVAVENLDIPSEQKLKINLDKLSNEIIYSAYRDDRVLKILREQPDKYFSLNEISTILGMSRHAVTRYIDNLYENELIESKKDFVGQRQLNLWKIKDQNSNPT